MKDQIITFETAKLAKEKGFNFNTFFFYEVSTNIRPTEENTPQYNIDNGEEHEGWLNYNDSGEFVISASTQSLLQKWLRDEHQKVVIIIYNKTKYGYFIHNMSCIYADGDIWEQCSDFMYRTYEEALEIGLQKALKLIK